MRLELAKYNKQKPNKKISISTPPDAYLINGSLNTNNSTNLLKKFSNPTNIKNRKIPLITISKSLSLAFLSSTNPRENAKNGAINLPLSPKISRTSQELIKPRLKESNIQALATINTLL